MILFHSGEPSETDPLSYLIFCRHHVFVKTGRQVQLAEVGPRFEMKRE
jgi:rRNA maturation protein Rpf1